MPWKDPVNLQALQEEQKRLRHLRVLVDLTAGVIVQSGISRIEAERMVEAMRRKVLQLFPGTEQTYDIIYRRRFERLIEEHTDEETNGSQ
jgi:hypothetical protein